MWCKRTCQNSSPYRLIIAFNARPEERKRERGVFTWPYSLFQHRNKSCLFMARARIIKGREICIYFAIGHTEDFSLVHFFLRPRWPFDIQQQQRRENFCRQRSPWNVEKGVEEYPYWKGIIIVIIIFLCLIVVCLHAAEIHMEENVFLFPIFSK